MPRRWTLMQRKNEYKRLYQLYVTQNKSLREISKQLHIPESTLYKRLCILNIPSQRNKKKKVNNISSNFTIPKKHSNELAELIGIMLGDGNIVQYQINVTLGNKEKHYAEHVQCLIDKVFSIKSKIWETKKGYVTVSFWSVIISKWLRNNGLVLNKVKEQVGVPSWIFKSKDFIGSFLRGFFDTDGSIYALRYGQQIAFTNASHPILKSLHTALNILEYHPSEISCNKIYITRRDEVTRFFKEIRPANTKHQARYKKISSE